MIDYSIRDEKLIFRVQVVPRASRSEVVGEHNGALRIRITAPPVDGAANREVIQLLARTFEVSRSAVRILSGHSGRTKQVSIEGTPESLVEVLACATGSSKKQGA